MFLEQKIHWHLQYVLKTMYPLSMGILYGNPWYVAWCYQEVREEGSGEIRKLPAVAEWGVLSCSSSLDLRTFSLGTREELQWVLQKSWAFLRVAALRSVGVTERSIKATYWNWFANSSSGAGIPSLTGVSFTFITWNLCSNVIVGWASWAQVQLPGNQPWYSCFELNPSGIFVQANRTFCSGRLRVDITHVFARTDVDKHNYVQIQWTEDSNGRHLHWTKIMLLYYLSHHHS